MNNVVKCGRCQKVMIAELFKTHTCTTRYKGSKEIEVDFFGKFTDDNGREVTVAYGMDGITYRMRQTDKEKIPIPLTLSSDESLQVEDSDGDFTEPK